jgi:hypothetical protein
MLRAIAANLRFTIYDLRAFLRAELLRAKDAKDLEVRSAALIPTEGAPIANRQ